MAGQPNKYNRIVADITTVPSSGMYVLTKSHENTNYADYGYVSNELAINIRAEKQSYICWLGTITDYLDFSVNFGRVGDMLSYSQGVFPSSDFYPMPSIEFVRSRTVQPGISNTSAPLSRFQIEKYRNTAGSYYAARPTTLSTGWKVFGQQLQNQFNPVLKTGPLTTLDAQPFQSSNICGTTTNGWIYGPCRNSANDPLTLYDFNITAIECIYSGGLPNRNAFTDA
jgi:hypothetical protein